MSLENRLRRGFDAQAAAMEDNVSSALDSVRDRAVGRRRMRIVGASLAAAATVVAGVLAGPALISALRDPDTSPAPIPPAGENTPSPSPTLPPTPTPTPTPPATPLEPMTVWFTSGELLQSSTRYIAEGDAEAQASELLEYLFAGPGAEETENFLGTAIPEGTTLRAISIQEGHAAIDLSSEFEAPSDGDGVGQRVGQIIWTLADLGVESVDILVEEQPLNLPTLGVTDPYTPEEFESLLMPITVSMPFAGQEVVASEIHIAGTANVFEATVTIRVEDADGNSILQNAKGKAIEETFTTATCGTGCRGTYEIDVPVGVGHVPIEATVVVYEVSAENGEPINEVRIPITIAAPDGDQ